MATLVSQKLIYSRETERRESRLESSGAGVSFRPLSVTDLPSPGPTFQMVLPAEDQALKTRACWGHFKSKHNRRRKPDWAE